MVTGERDNNQIQEIPGGYQNVNGVVGVLGVKNVMDTPFQQTNLSQKSIDTFAANPSEQSVSVLINVPSIRSAGNTLYNDFSIRGQNANAYQFRINGIPGLLSQTNVPINMMGSVDVISGPGIGVTGVQAKESAGGVINFQTKRAGQEDITNYTTYFSGRSIWGNMIDVSRRLGDDKAWGIRVNAAYSDGDTGIVKETETQKNFAINIDHQAERSFTNIFLGYRDTHTDRAERYFDFSSPDLSKIPAVPNSKNNYAFQGQNLGMKTWMATFNHVQKLDDSMKLFINAGYAYNNGYDYLVDASSRLDVTSDDGSFTRSIVNEPFAIRNKYFQIGLNKTFNVGEVKNDLVLSFDKDWYEARWGNSPSTKGTVTGNLYDGSLNVDFITAQGQKALYSGDSQFYGWTFADTLSYKKWDATIGVHHHVSRVFSTSSGVTKTDATSPLFALVYKPNENWTIYGNHAESFDAGTLVSTSSYSNPAGSVLDPIKTKSNEIGIKYTNGNIVSALSYFDMKQDAKFEVPVTGQKPLLTLDGENRFKGIEYSISGKVAPKWTVSGGFLYLNSETTKNTSSFLNGKTVLGTPDWSAVLTLEYAPNESMDVWGRMVYTGDAPIYHVKQEKELTIPSSTVFDAGIRFRSHINSVPVTYNLTVFNVFNKDYWMPRAGYSYGILSNPRTFYLGATFHL